MSLDAETKDNTMSLSAHRTTASKAYRSDPTRTEGAKARAMQKRRDQRAKSTRLFLAIAFKD